MGLHNAIVWTPEMDNLIGSASDAQVGRQLGLSEAAVRNRRLKLGLSTYRSSRAQVTMTCANCGTTMTKKRRDLKRAQRLFCTRTCADAGQKRRDTDTLRYGPGWANRRAEIRRRDKTCRVCGTPPTPTTALHVHHLVPFRYGGTNRPENLVALCDSCHHKIEAATNRVLDSVLVEVTLAGSDLTITVDSSLRWHGSVRGVDYPTMNG